MPLIAGAVGLGCQLLAPFTFDASLVGEGVALGALGATALTIGTVSISTAELCIILGASLAALAIKNGYDVEVSYDGHSTKVRLRNNY